MAGLTPIHAYGGSAHSVPLSVLDTLDDDINALDAVLGHNLDQLIDEARKDLRRTLLQHPAWAPYANDVSIEWDVGGIDYLFHSQEAMALEYGTADAPAHPIIRSFAMTRADEISAKISKALVW